MRNEEILMMRCVYCNEEWIREEDELVCEKCAPQVEVDIAIAEVRAGLEVLKKADDPPLTTRCELIKEISREFRDLIWAILP